MGLARWSPGLQTQCGGSCLPVFDQEAIAAGFLQLGLWAFTCPADFRFHPGDAAQEEEVDAGDSAAHGAVGWSRPSLTLAPTLLPPEVV